MSDPCRADRLPRRPRLNFTELRQKPQRYAQFLGQELALVYRGLLLVIMPSGFGIYQANNPSTRQQAILAGLQAPKAAEGLGAAALTAVLRLAAGAGHSLPTPAAPAASKSSSTDTMAWLVFALGGALIALAWGASLRARPLAPRRGRSVPI